MDVITGKNTVKSALIAQKKIDRIILDKGAQASDIQALAEKCGIAVELAPRAKIDALAEFGNHQGVAAIIEPFAYVSVSHIIEVAKAKNQPPFIIVLDHIEDPHNFGAILRTAEAAGVHGVIIPNRRSASVTNTVYKTSTGAAFFVNIALVSNIANTLDSLKKKGLWVYCLDASGKNIYKENMMGPVAVVIGSEGFGVSDLVKKKCDFTVSIPMYGRITSLNASVSAGAAIYEIVRQRNENEK